MGILKVKSKEEIIIDRKRNSQCGWVWNEPDIRKIGLITEIFIDGKCTAVTFDKENRFYEGEAVGVDVWNHYKLTEETKQPLYKPWTKQPFESMFEAQEWEFKRKHTNSFQILVAFNEDEIRFVNNHFTNEKMFEQHEMRQRGGEWQPCGELATE